MARSQKAAAAAATKAQKVADREAVRAHKEYEKQVREATREATREAVRVAKAAEPKRPRGRPRKNPETESIASAYLDAPVLTLPQYYGRQPDDTAELRSRLASLETAYAELNRRFQSIRTIVSA